MKRLEQSSGSSARRRGAGYQGCDGRYHRRPRCRLGTCSPNSQWSSAYSGRHCKAQPRQWRRGVRGRRRTQAWISCHNRSRDAQEGESQNQIQFHLQKSGRSGSLGEKSSYPRMISHARPRHPVALPEHGGSCPMCRPKSLCQLCSDLEHSYWPHPPFR